MIFTCHHCQEKLEGDLQLMLDHLKLCQQPVYERTDWNDPDLRLKYDYERDKQGYGKYYWE